MLPKLNYDEIYIMFDRTDVHTGPDRRMDKTMVDKLMYILNDDAQNYPFCRFQLLVETFGDSTN